MLPADGKQGKAIVDIKSSHADFPDVAAQGSAQVVWRNCDFGFVDGVLTSIAPADGGRAVDGVGPGMPASKATALYGTPVTATDNKDGTSTAVYAADQSAGTAYRMLLAGTAETGTIKTIVLCRCLPRKPPPVTTPAAPSRAVATADPSDPCGWG